MTTTTQRPAAASGTFAIGGDMIVNRLGFGAMRITGEGIWGPPKDRTEAVRVVQRAVELGVNLIDTADSYGPDISEEIIAEALHPYGDDLVIATKGGLTRSGPNIWQPVGRPEYLRQQVHMSLRKLKVERIDLWQLHRFDAKVPVEESLGAITELQDQGLIRHIGLSEITVEELKRAQQVATIVTVQNRYNLTDREWEATLDECTAQGIGFIPWFPLATGALSKHGGIVDKVAEAHAATPGQVALAWLLKRSPVILPIPGTGSLHHLEENLLGGALTLTDEDFAELDEAGRKASA